MKAPIYSYHLDVPHALEREATRLDAAIRSLGNLCWPERADLEDIAARLRDYSVELRRYQEDYQR